MKNMPQQVEGSNSTFTNIPVISLDSGAVRVRVEVIEHVIFSRFSRRVVHIKNLNAGSCAWG